MGPIVIYGMPPSPPCRILMMTCDVIGIEYEMRPCNITKGENRTPEYLKVRST
jgi:glutathione S-transferase